MPEWFKDFLELRRFGLGRLQYDLWEHREDTVIVNGFKIEKGFKKYLQENNKFGTGRGAALFDGKNILTRKEI